MVNWRGKKEEKSVSGEGVRVQIVLLTKRCIARSGVERLSGERSAFDDAPVTVPRSKRFVYIVNTGPIEEGSPVVAHRNARLRFYKC